MVTVNFLQFSGGLVNVATGGDDTSSTYVPNPSTYEVELADLDLDSTRNTNGSLSRTRISKDNTTVKCSWGSLTETQLNRLYSGFDTNTVDGKFKLTFLNPTGKPTRFVTKDMYVQGTRNFKLARFQTDPTQTLWSTSLEFIAFDGTQI